MKRTTKILLFLAVTALTYAGLQTWVGKDYHCSGNFRGHCSGTTVPPAPVTN